MQNLKICSRESAPRALLFPLGGGLQSTIRLRVRTEAFGAFSATRIDTEWQGGDDLAWSWGTASLHMLQQSSTTIATACGDVIKCNVHIARAERCRTGTGHAAHHSCKPHISGFSTCSISSSSWVWVAGGRAATNHQWTRHQVVCIVFKEVVQINLWHKNYVANMDSRKTPNRFSQYFIFEYCA